MMDLQVCYAKAVRAHARKAARRAEGGKERERRPSGAAEGGVKRERDTEAFGPLLREGKRERRPIGRYNPSSPGPAAAPAPAAATVATAEAEGEAERSAAGGGAESGEEWMRPFATAPLPPPPPVREAQGYKLYLAERGGIAGSHSTGYRGVHFRPNKAKLQFEARAPPGEGPEAKKR